MKNKKLLILPILMAGVSLSGCDVGMGTMGLAKISNYSNEVSYSEFASTLVENVKKSRFGSESYKPGDAVIKTEVKGTFNQKVTNNAYKQSTRNEAKLKLNTDAKFSYDADNESLDGTAKVNFTLKEENALLGKANASYKNELNVASQPGKENKYSLISKDDEFFYNLDLGEGGSLNDLIAEFVREGVKELSTEVEEGLSDDAIKEFINSMNEDENMNASLKFYADNQVFTAVFNVDYRENLKSREIINDQETYLTYGKVHYNVECVAQIKVEKVLKVVASVKGKIEADFSENRSSVLDDFIPTFSGLVSGDCAEGDKEVIDLDLVAGVSLEQKDVTNEKVDLSQYREIK